MPRQTTLTRLSSSERRRVVSTSAVILGDIAHRNLYSSLEEFLGAVIVGSEAREFVVVALQSRVDRTRRRSVQALLAEYRRNPNARWVAEAVRSGNGLYCTFRHTAAPRSQQARLDVNQGLHLSRRLQRCLRSHGVMADRHSDAGTLHERACARLRGVWGSLAGRNVVLWIDNYYRRRVVANPAVGYCSLSCTVMSVLHLPAVDMNPSPPDIGAMFGRRHRVVNALFACRDVFVGQIQALVSDVVHPDEVRVPLDVRRRTMRSLQWLPF